MDIVFFTNQSDLRKWFIKNHVKENELYIGFYKVKSGRPCVSWSQAVDEALCFGWIDAVRKSIDEKSYFIRFTKRNPKSNWSLINIKKIKDLKVRGLLTPAGIRAFEKRSEKKSGIYSYENEAMKLKKEYEKKLKADKKAWAFFQSQPPSYQKIVTRWIMTAKQETTQIKRLNELINDSKAGLKIKSQRY
jgi:uncharacterized protein YdeI (YjbR/CyaY-like superfamily)